MNNIHLPPFPQRLTLEVTNRCNLACHFCPRHQTDMEAGDLDFDLFLRLTGEAARNLPVALVMFFRGEPLLHPRLPEMIRHAKRLGLGPVQLASNGLLLTPALARELLGSGLDFISFSLDTNDGALYKKARINGDLSLAEANVLHFIEEARQRPNPPEIQISSVNHPDYLPGQAAFVEFWRRKADKVRIYAEHSADGHFGSLKHLTPMEDGRMPCRKVFTDMVVYWNGQSALCNHDWQSPKGALGDANKQSLAEIWNSAAYSKIREAHRRGVFNEGHVCANCDHWRIYYNPEGFIGEMYERI